MNGLAARNSLGFFPKTSLSPSWHSSCGGRGRRIRSHVNINQERKSVGLKRTTRPELFQSFALRAVSNARGVFASSQDSLWTFSAKDIDGNDVDLGDFEGSVALVVNVASKWGLTPQYKDLEALYQKYKSKGFVVLGFPCNQFGKQEPGDEATIKEFVTSKFGVTFPMFSKVEVNGSGADPISKFLKSSEAFEGDEITWNFGKFLVGKDGQVANSYIPRVAPFDLEDDVLELLG